MYIRKTQINSVGYMLLAAALFLLIGLISFPMYSILNWAKDGQSHQPSSYSDSWLDPEHQQHDYSPFRHFQ